MFMPYYYKSPNTLTNQGTHNLPLSSTLKLWEVLTWLSEGIWPTPHHCSLLGPFFFVLCRCHRDYVCTVWLIVDFLASSNTINSVSKRGLFFTLQTPSKSTTNSTANNKHTKKKKKLKNNRERRRNRHRPSERGIFWCAQMVFSEWMVAGSFIV